MSPIDYKNDPVSQWCEGHGFEVPKWNRNGYYSRNDVWEKPIASGVVIRFMRAGTGKWWCILSDDQGTGANLGFISLNEIPAFVERVDREQPEPMHYKRYFRDSDSLGAYENAMCEAGKMYAYGNPVLANL